MTAAYIGTVLENKDYMILYINEEGLDNGFAYVLYNKKSKKVKFQRFSATGIIPNSIGSPLSLTENNTILFALEVELLEELTEAYPLFNSIKEYSIEGGASILELQIK